MGAGSTPAGVSGIGGFFERAGVDTPYIPAPITFTPIVAIQFDPSTRRFVQNADGTLSGVHPIDQIVALRLWVAQGDLASAPNAGTRIRARIARVAQDTIPQIVHDEVTSALRSLLDAGDIELVNRDDAPGGIAVDIATRGAPKMAVYYRNLRSTDRRTRVSNSTASPSFNNTQGP